MAASILKISIPRNSICDNLVGFPKSGHIYVYSNFKLLMECFLGASLLYMLFNMTAQLCTYFHDSNMVN